VALIVCGIYLTTLPSLSDWLRPLRSLELVSSRWALVSGFCIAVYTLADRQGVRLVSPVIYNVDTFVIMAAGFAPYMLLTSRRLTTGGEFKAHWLGIASTGIVNVGNYLIVLWALTVLPASYVSAVRGSSIILG